MVNISLFGSILGGGCHLLFMVYRLKIDVGWMLDAGC